MQDIHTNLYKHYHKFSHNTTHLKRAYTYPKRNHIDIEIRMSFTWTMYSFIQPYSHCVVGSAARVNLFHLFLFIGSFSWSPSLFILRFSMSFHLIFCLPTLLPITVISIAFFTGSSSSLLFTCPKYLNLVFSLYTPHILHSMTVYSTK